MTVCSSCGTSNPSNLKFCFECGARLALACASCGAPLLPGAKFCGECGAPAAASAPPAGARPSGAGSSPAPVAERRLVSVLFADLVGFTTLADGRDPEETRELLSRYFDLARETVERYAGTVEKFIGDAVMAVWGAPIAREDDAERAVRAALELVAAVRSLGPNLQARAGVLTGEAAVTIGATGQGMVAGDLVNTASRLQSAAAPGTVLVGEATQRAAAGAIAFETAGEQSLKGKAAPVPAFRALRVVAERGGRGRSETLEAPFVGRDDELRLLKDLFHATSREGRARLVSVIGPAGIGKTRLAWEFLKYIDGLIEDVWWHEGRSPAYGEGISFWALGEMIRGRCGLAETDDEATTRAKVAETVREHVHDDTERRWIEGAILALLGLGDGKVATAELFGAWRTFFERLSETGIVVLVFEDFNNADSGLIDFVDSILEWSRNKPICVLTLARPELLERRPDWHAKRNFNSITLEPLTDTAMTELLGGLVPGLPAPAARSIIARADGMPLYAVETVRMLLAEGKLELQDGVYRPVGDLHDLAVPDTLTALISSRIDSLEPADRGLVHDASVLGQAFTAAGLAALSGVTEADLEPHLRTLLRREIVTRSLDPRSPDRGSYTFVQALVREVAYNTLAKADRKSRHLAAARFFESLGTDELAGAVAGQYLAAQRNASSGAEAEELAGLACDALCSAADRATALGSFEQAAGFDEQALTVTAKPAERARLLEHAGEAFSKAALYQRAVTSLRESADTYRSIGDRRAAARAIATLGRAYGHAFNPKEAIAILEPAVKEFEDLAQEEAGLALRVALARSLMLSNDDPGAVAMADSALPGAEHLELNELVALALMAKGASFLALGRTNEGMAVIRAGIDLAEANGRIADSLNGRVALMASLGLRDPQAALDIGRAGLAESRRLGLRSRALIFAGNFAESARFTGDWDDAFAVLESALEGTADSDTRSFLLAAQIEIRARRGEDVTERIEGLKGLFDASPESDQDQRDLTLFDLEANIGLAQDRLASARAAARAESELSTLNAPTAMALATRASIWMRDPAAAAEDLAAMEATGVHGGLVSHRRTAFLAGIAALEGRVEEARPMFVEARRGLLDMGLLFEAALVAIDMATVLGPSDPDAIAAAADARPLLERVGARPYLARLDSALDRG